ncbi:MAG: hypothetical protein LBS20_21625 [Prevotella sp.]|jgi:hypothetical protein|nr:hypothetical protein [Prevotella sp.]
MEQDEIDKEIEHVKRNLKFFSIYWDELSRDSASRETMLKTVDYLLDKLIVLLKLKG